MYGNKTNTGSYGNKTSGTPRGGYSKPAAKTDGPSRPAASLSFGVKNGDGMDFHDVTGLFAATDKSGGEYLKVSVKEDITIPAGATLFLRPVKPKA